MVFEAYGKIDGLLMGLSIDFSYRFSFDSSFAAAAFTAEIVSIRIEVG